MREARIHVRHVRDLLKSIDYTDAYAGQECSSLAFLNIITQGDILGTLILLQYYDNYGISYTHYNEVHTLKYTEFIRVISQHVLQESAQKYFLYVYMATSFVHS